MSKPDAQTEWAVFGPAFWDADTLVAKAADGRWIYPGRGFEPESGQYYYLTLNKRISRTTQKPYYIGYPRHGGVITPPAEFVQLLQRIEALENQIQAFESEKRDWLEQMITLQDEVDDLREENLRLRVRLGRERAAETPQTTGPQMASLGQLLSHCTREDLLGHHPKAKEKKVYRQLMQLIHPDKTRDFGPQTLAMLEALVKAVNQKYHQ